MKPKGNECMHDDDERAMGFWAGFGDGNGTRVGRV